MIQAKPYEFMVKYTPQREWSEGMGAMIAVAFFFGGISGGLYLVSLYFNSLWGMFISWVCAMLMGLFDMVHLSKPQRFWRVALKPNSSWISRGFIFIILFIGCTAIQLALSYWLRGTALETLFKILSGILAFGVAIYSGFVVSFVSGIRLWNSAIMPVLFLTSGLVGGVAIILALNLNATQIQYLEGIMQLALIVYAIVIALHLWIATYSSPSAKDSVMQILKGSVAAIFWGVIVIIGIVIPLVVTSVVGTESATLLLIAVICVILGNLALRYVILKAGMYSPLVPSHEIEYIE